MGRMRKMVPGQNVLADPEMVRAFSKERIITYASVIFLPPYGFYRVWQKDSAFTRAERWVWSMIVISYLGCLLQLIF